MPGQTIWDVLAQLVGTRTPTFDPGTGGGGPTGMAPGQPYPSGGGALPAHPWDYPGYPGDYGFDLWRGPGPYYYPEPRRAFGLRAQPLGTYDPQGQPAQGPMGNFTPLGFGRSAMPPPEAQVWGVPLLPDAMRQAWMERLRQWMEQDPWEAPPSRF